ncbi:hypothetical protein CYMTET_36073 [Cymbomonas tetramitiformis]|uniref:C2 domain-containing protein n=1 Tax=Cymbomonas tetramitiformis TaxID=36881 RepID=A0AAE0KMR5_9CHLO|nr:hypothetical protein CYMTET_36073 [Cymbomonas tetramitiformis]
MGVFDAYYACVSCCYSGKADKDFDAIGNDYPTENFATTEALQRLHTDEDDQVMRIEMQVSADDLTNAEILGKVDPFCVLFTREIGESGAPDGFWVEHGRTEIISNENSPIFVASFTLDFHFQKLQPLRVVVLDAAEGSDSNTLDWGKQIFLGQAEFLLSDLATLESQSLTVELTNSEDLNAWSGVTGSLTFTFEEVTVTSAECSLLLRASNLAVKDCLGRCDPFLNIYRSTQDGSGTDKVYKSEVTHGNEPTWAPATLAIQRLCNGDFERPLLVDVLDRKRNGEHALLGSVTTSLQDLQTKAQSGSPLILRNGKGKPKGELVVSEATVRNRPTFLQYIQSGCEMNFMVAVDFTASNGKPSDPASLHYAESSAAPSPYEQAIRAIGAVLECYDKDKMFPGYGFGGRPSMDEEVEHCFALNGQGFHPDVKGVQGIADAYKQAVQRMLLAGPTFFEPLINTAAAKAEEMHACRHSNQRYLVLTILCDGMINDMDSTVEAIVKTSHLPFSIFIIGIGRADFADMEMLDARGGLLASRTGKRAQRNNVQFIELGANPALYEVRSISEKLLQDLPGQLMAYMRANNLFPMSTLDGKKHTVSYIQPLSDRLPRKSVSSHF